jgi:hypothetical protein
MLPACDNKLPVFTSATPLMSDECCDPDSDSDSKSSSFIDDIDVGDRASTLVEHNDPAILSSSIQTSLEMQVPPESPLPSGIIPPKTIRLREHRDAACPMSLRGKSPTEQHSDNVLVDMSNISIPVPGHSNRLGPLLQRE